MAQRGLAVNQLTTPHDRFMSQGSGTLTIRNNGLWEKSSVVTPRKTASQWIERYPSIPAHHNDFRSNPEELVKNNPDMRLERQISKIDHWLPLQKTQA